MVSATRHRYFLLSIRPGRNHRIGGEQVYGYAADGAGAKYQIRFPVTSSEWWTPVKPSNRMNSRTGSTEKSPTPYGIFKRSDMETMVQLTAQIGLLNLRIVHEVPRGAFGHHVAVFQQVATLGELEGHARVLFHKQNGGAFPVDFL